jgi:hypothetical protein
MMPALAWGGRMRWRGVAVEGKAPARLEEAARAEVAVALRPLGVEVVDKGAADEESGAKCVFAGGVAQCSVAVVRKADGGRAERKAEIPFKDADDLARSLALLLADTIQIDLPNVVPEHSTVGENENANANANPTDSDHEPARSKPKVQAKVEKPSPPFPSAKLFVDVGPVVAFGFSGEPLMYGATVRATQAIGPLRIGGTISLTGNRDLRDGFALSFLRVVTGPRGGFGFQAGRVAFDASLGPALFLVAMDAQPGGHHNLIAAAACLGARLAVALARPLAIALNVDGILTFTEGFIDAGTNRVADFGRFSLEVSLSLAYRR